MSKMIKKSCPECFSQKQYCEECSLYNATVIYWTRENKK